MGNIVPTNINTNQSTNQHSNIPSQSSLNINYESTSNLNSNPNIQEAFSDKWHFYKHYDF